MAARSKKKDKKLDFHVEIERKFLLKRFPAELLKKRKHEVIEINQYYFNIKGTWNRYRVTNNKKEIKYIHTIKKSAGLGMEHEYEKEIDKKEFLKLFKKYQKKHKLIRKTRYVIKFKSLKFEIDVYKDLSLVVLEVELPKLSFKFDFPNGLEEEIIYELTGIKQFSNLNLATWIIKRRK